MKTYFNTILMLVLVISTASAQAPDTLWTRTIGGVEADFGRRILQTQDGGFAILGHTNSFTAGGYDIYLIKTDSDGNTLWTRNYGGSGDDYCGGFRQTGDGGFIIGGTTNSFGAVLADYHLIKTDSAGDTLWTKVINGDDDDNCTDVGLTWDGGYILSGFSSSSGSAGAYDAVLLKTDGDGNVSWIRYYGGESADKIYTVKQTSDGGYIAAGESGSFVLYDQEAYLIRTDASGDTLWTRSYGMPYYYLQDVFYGVTETPDGGFLAVGGSCSFSFGYYDIFAVKTDTQGDTLWTRLYGNPWDDIGYGLTSTTDGGYIIAGVTKRNEGPFFDGYLVKIEADGDSLWTFGLGGPIGENDDYFYSAVQAEDGKYLAAGMTDAYGAGEIDVWLVCLAAESVFVKNRSDYIPGECVLYEPYPNPFNQAVNLSFQLPAPGYVTLKAFDLQGREAGLIAEGEYSAGIHHKTFDAFELASGIYFICLEAGGVYRTQKVVLLK